VTAAGCGINDYIRQIDSRPTSSGKGAVGSFTGSIDGALEIFITDPLVASTAAFKPKKLLESCEMCFQMW
jgi:hypothetical protein